MTEDNGQPELKTVDFDGDRYAVEDLTPRVVEGFNMLVKLQGELAEYAYQLRKAQAAQIGVSAEVKNNIKEDKIKALPDEEVVEEAEIKELNG